MLIGFWWGNPRIGNLLEELGFDGKLKYKWILKKHKLKSNLGVSGLGQALKEGIFVRVP
jgi:hypothetical protein